MKRKMGVLGLILVLLALVSFLFGKQWDGQGRKGELSGRETEAAKEREKLVVVFPGSYANTEDLTMVEERVNEIVCKELGIEVELRVISGHYSNTVKKMLAGKEQVDIVNMGNQLYMESYINGYLCDIEELLLRYGQGIIDAVGMENINACRIRDVLYGLTNNRDYAAGWDGYVLRKDILDKYQIKKEDLKTIEDLEAVYDLLLEKEPDIIPVASGASMLSNFPLADGINGFPAGGHLNYGQEEELVNIFESEEYKERLRRVRKWYLKGYLGDYSPIEEASVRGRMKRGEIFSIPTNGKPGIEQQESMACGRELVFVQFGETAITYNSMAASPWVITQNTVDQKASMQLLNLMYTNGEIMNLLSYGVEGVHYVKTEDGHITLPEGKTENIFISNAWRMPNQFITYVWEGNPLNMWELMDEHNKNALQSCEIGFNFDISEVTSQYVAVNSIYSKYRRILENGLVDPEQGLEAMLKDLRENGLDEVIDEKRKQFMEWKKRN